MKKLFVAGALAAGLFSGPHLLALSYNAATDGITPQSGYSFTYGGGNGLGLKAVAGHVGLGVRGGYSGNEIDIGQWLQVDFGTPQHVDVLTLAFLYNGPEFGDPQEQAALITDGITTYYLQATGDMTASWSGNGGNSSVQNVSPATLSGGGVWKIENPFAGEVSSIRFAPVDIWPSRNGQDSDFSLHSFRTSVAVPDGGSTLALIGLAMCGLYAAGRRAKA